MEIQYIDLYCFVFKGKKEQVAVDPTGIDGYKFEGRVLLSTKNVWNLPKTDENQVVIAGPGEYEVGGVEVTGLSAGSETTVYVVTIDGVAIGVMGAPSEDLSEKKIERIDALDVLLVPCEGAFLDKLKSYLAMAKKWGVNYLIPVGYKKDEELKKFLDVTDNEGMVPIDSLKINRDELPEGMEVVVLKKRK